MIRISEIASFLEDFAPAALAESWDNVGLLVGRPDREVKRVMTCLTVTPASAREAIEEGVELIVSHHPLPFQPLKRLTTETTEGRLLLDLAEARIGVFSPHTAFDSAEQGINRRLADGLQLLDVRPLIPSDRPELGSGRFGRLASPVALAELAQRVKKLLAIDHLQVVGAMDQIVETVAVACGSAGEFLTTAHATGCDALVTGEMRFHTSLEAESLDMCLVLAGHFASERFSVEALAEILAERFPSLQVWASRTEQDPLKWL